MVVMFMIIFITRIGMLVTDTKASFLLQDMPLGRVVVVNARSLNTRRKWFRALPATV